MSRAGARWPVCIGLLLVLVGCTTTIDHQVAVRPSPAGSPGPVPSMSSVLPSTIATSGGGDAPKATAPPVLPWPQPPAAALPASRAHRLQAAVQRIAEVAAAAGMQGITAAVVSAQGSWTGAVGVDGAGVSLVPEAMMGIGEATDTVTAAEVLVLAQAGRIDLDAPLSRYLESPLLSRGPTVRQALSHTSGIPDFLTQSLMNAIKADPTRSWTAEQALNLAPDLITQTGLPFRLSMSNYLMLGMLIEKITGLGYAAAVQRDLLSGNGSGRMVVQDAQLPGPPLAAPDRSDGVVPDGHFLPNRAIASSAGAAGGIAADALTLARWGYRLYGGLVLSPDWTAAMSTPITEQYGLGTFIVGDGPQGAPDARLTGIGAIGHPGLVFPGYQALLLVIPDDQLSVSVLTIAPGTVGSTEAPVIVADILDVMRS